MLFDFFLFLIHFINLIYSMHSRNILKLTGNWQDRLKDKFLGLTLQLKTPSILVNTQDRFELLTESMGTVRINLQILSRNFEKFGCDM